MYGIKTTQGRFAIKVLNSFIMQRPTAITNFVRSERIANIAAKVVPAAPAIQFDGVTLHKLGHYYLQAFNWVEGVVLKPDDISINHCTTIGAILADLHLADFSTLSIEPPNAANGEQTIDWNEYLKLGEDRMLCWIEQLRDIIDKLYIWDAEANEAVIKLSVHTVISHNDLDPKNVLWDNRIPTIIDWECAGFINPMQDLIETALYWATDRAGNADQKRFLAFIHAYQAKTGPLATDWRIVLSSGFTGKLGWLAYNLRRSLGIESNDAAEQQLGTEQVMATLQALCHYEEQIEKIETWLRSIASN
ncbi:hypothetical protein PCCS19_45590 [Paenibacillus sp. CCS19]|nr:hypothetical protein PCCS19_45590 [Paenibacillus cellulosilyticus]